MLEDCTIEWHFHWKFWRPKACIGGPVYFGWWARVRGRCPTSGMWRNDHQSASQVRIKQELGIFPWF